MSFLSVLVTTLEVATTVATVLKNNSEDKL